MPGKPAERDSDIENPDATPQLPPAPGFAVPETVGGGEGGGGGNRRKRRRNRNRNRENGQQPQQPQATPQVDKEELVRRAWKIFLGEVTEEGLALMDDRTAAEASRRAFRVASSSSSRLPATAPQLLHRRWRKSRLTSPKPTTLLRRPCRSNDSLPQCSKCPRCSGNAGI